MADNLRHSQPLGIETNFGYDRDFKEKYRLWRLIPRDDYSGVVDAIELCSLGKTFDVKFISKREVRKSLDWLKICVRSSILSIGMGIE